MIGRCFARNTWCLSPDLPGFMSPDLMGRAQTESEETKEHNLLKHIRLDETTIGG